MSSSIFYDQKFIYLPQESYEENFQRWWKMNTLEKELYSKYWNSNEVIFTEDEAREKFADLFS